MFLPKLAGAALIAFTSTNVEAAGPSYREVPLDLDDCAGIAVKEFAPANSTIHSFEKEERGIVTHEFGAVMKHDGLEQSLIVLTYPNETGPGSIVITVREINKTYNYLAVGAMDIDDLQSDATMDVYSTAQENAAAEQTVTQRAASAIRKIAGCVAKPEDLGL